MYCDHDALDDLGLLSLGWTLRMEHSDADQVVAERDGWPLGGLDGPLMEIQCRGQIVCHCLCGSACSWHPFSSFEATPSHGGDNNPCFAVLVLLGVGLHIHGRMIKVSL